MGRYERKTEGPSWSREALNEAVEAVRSGRMSGYAAASTFAIPRKTIMDHVTDIVKGYVKQNYLKTPFNDGTPGKDWFSSFKKRYNLSIKKPQAVEVARKKAADPLVIQEFYNILDRVIADLGLQDKPERIYKLDETSLIRVTSLA
ncbi:unnamed protein product [Pieris brassicae]|uniref:HTH psq-type domain-containing protein n=1 Tax=Pieris brassicae TaxID=7116 RepID=A0A9P0T239_PIEBR|nr:unnamed protein product [Pieris brassicae]